VPEARFDEVIHAPLRLRVCGLLRRADRIEFTLLRETLGISDAALSKHIKVLTNSGYVRSHKTASEGRTDARRIMWLSLTREGKDAFDSHIHALQEIVEPRN
jgi:DNA-binding MarR family transcriptional regulator